MKLSLKSQIATAAALLVIGTSTYAAPIITGSNTVTRDNTGDMKYTPNPTVNPSFEYTAKSNAIWSGVTNSVDAFNTIANTINTTTDLTAYLGGGANTIVSAVNTASNTINTTVTNGNNALKDYADHYSVGGISNPQRILVDANGASLTGQQVYTGAANASGVWASSLTSDFNTTPFGK